MVGEAEYENLFFSMTTSSQKQTKKRTTEVLLLYDIPKVILCRMLIST